MTRTNIAREIDRLEQACTTAQPSEQADILRKLETISRKLSADLANTSTRPTSAKGGQTDGDEDFFDNMPV